jgi:hypothetical protein
MHFAGKNSTPADVEKLADKRTPNLGNFLIKIFLIFSILSAENRQIFEKLLSIGLSCTEVNLESR